MCLPEEVPYSMNGLNGCSEDDECPENSYCFKKTKICCGQAGQCPESNEHALKNEYGQLKICSFSADCPNESKCRESITVDGLITGAKLCCASKKYSCELSGIPFPSVNNPQQCLLDKPMDCPIDMQCQKRYNFLNILF